MKRFMLQLTLSFTLIQCVIPFRLPESFLARKLKSNNSYFETTDAEVLGWRSEDSSDGNPLKGLLANPTFYNFDPTVTNIDASMDQYYIGLDEIMVGDPDLLGDAAFDWSGLEERLEASASRYRHGVLTFMVHWPDDRLYLPGYLTEEGIPLYPLGDPGDPTTDVTPDYGNDRLLRAFELFIQAFGSKYDGDKRIGYIVLGLLGFWGEWHTHPLELVPGHARKKVVEWYHQAFKITKLQTRYPFQPAYEANMGLADGSFAYHTLDGDANGGVVNDHWYFWPLVEQLGHNDFWHRAPMGGETRPELQPHIFEPSYPAGTFEKQDFHRCLRTTHATYMFFQDAFVHGGYTGEKLANALKAHTRLGYNYMVSKVAAAESTTFGMVDIDVTIRQVGVAPFYYPLSLVLDCGMLPEALKQDGVETIIADKDEKTFTFTGISAATACLNEVILSLDSPFAYEGRPVRFAQKSHDAVGFVHLKVPQPFGISDAALEAGVGDTDQISFTLIKADGSNEVLQPLQDGDALDLFEHGSKLSVRAYAEEGVSAVKFYFDGKVRLEELAPFSLGGDIVGEYFAVPYLSEMGNKTISAMAYDASSAPIGRLTVSFAVMDSGKTKNATPSPTEAASSILVDTFGPTATPAERADPTTTPALSPLAAVPIPETSQGTDKNSPWSSPNSHSPPKDTDKTSPEDIHGFNTPFTPDILDLAERDGEIPSKQNQIKVGISKGGIAGVVAAFLVVLTILVVHIDRRSKRSDTQDDDLPPRFVLPDFQSVVKTTHDDSTVTGESTTSSVRHLLRRDSTISVSAT